MALAGAGGIMNDKRYKVRKWLEESLDDEFENFIKNAKLTPRQVRILRLKIKDGLFNYQISREINLSTEKIRDELRIVYDRGIKLLKII